MRNYFRYISLLFAFFVLSSQAFAQFTEDSVAVQKNDSILNEMTDISKKVKGYVTPKDSIPDNVGEPVIYQLIDSILARIDESKLYMQKREPSGILKLQEREWEPFDRYVTFIDTVIYDPAFLPVIFEGKILPSDLDFLQKKAPLFAPKTKTYHLISPDSTFVPQLTDAQRVQVTRRQYYTENPERINLNVFTMQKAPTVPSKVVDKPNPMKELLTAEDPIEVSTPEVEKMAIKPLYWLKNGEHRLQFSYNTYSDQWGGDNNFDLYSNQKFNINYKKGKIEFNNNIEWRLQLKQITSVEDKDKEENKNKGKINIIEDYLRTYSTFGIKAIRNWSYSSNLEMKTPIFKKQTTDAKRVLQREFLSPFELNLGVGMRYSKELTSKSNKYRKLNFAADLSALSINYKYVRSDSIPVTWFGIEEGDKSKTEYGSTFNINMSYSHSRLTKYTTRIKYFTNYERAYAEWENTFDFTLNRYFSATLYFYLKYDDSVGIDKKRDNNWGYYNYNQMIRFGLTYVW